MRAQSCNILNSNRKISSVGVALGIAASVLWSVPGALAAQKIAAETPLQSHRALYDMTLSEVRQGANISGAKGVMYYRFEKLCDGWEVETRVALRLNYGTSGETEIVDTKWSFSSFETFDGKRLSFQVDHSQDGELLEVYDGDAFREPATGVGKADFYVPGNTKAALPEGTLFPAKHLIQLLNQARMGQRRDYSTVFDGASIVNPYRINTMILGSVDNNPFAGLLPVKPVAAGIDGENATAMPAHLGSDPKIVHDIWRFRMAYFPVANASSLPDFELEIDYRDDGVATRIQQDFGDFALGLTPSEIETIPVRDCR